MPDWRLFFNELAGRLEVIQFPIIRRLKIENYELFQNENSDSISHSFDRGVHAVVGINGLGKTTLLSLLYRMLLGPYDQSKSDDAGCRRQARGLSRII
jgi:AAA15 family ATPase/GTPase